MVWAPPGFASGLSFVGRVLFVTGKICFWARRGLVLQAVLLLSFRGRGGWWVGGVAGGWGQGSRCQPLSVAAAGWVGGGGGCCRREVVVVAGPFSAASRFLLPHLAWCLSVLSASGHWWLPTTWFSRPSCYLQPGVQPSVRLNINQSGSAGRHRSVRSK